MKITVRALLKQAWPFIKRELVSLFFKLIGETLKDKMIRLIIIGALSSYGVEIPKFFLAVESEVVKAIDEKPAE